MSKKMNLVASAVLAGLFSGMAMAEEPKAAATESAVKADAPAKTTKENKGKEHKGKDHNCKGMAKEKDGCKGKGKKGDKDACSGPNGCDGTMAKSGDAKAPATPPTEKAAK